MLFCTSRCRPLFLLTGVSVHPAPGVMSSLTSTVVVGISDYLVDRNQGLFVTICFAVVSLVVVVFVTIFGARCVDAVRHCAPHLHVGLTRAIWTWRCVPPFNILSAAAYPDLPPPPLFAHLWLMHAFCVCCLLCASLTGDTRSSIQHSRGGTGTGGAKDTAEDGNGDGVNGQDGAINENGRGAAASQRFDRGHATGNNGSGQSGNSDGGSRGKGYHCNRGAARTVARAGAGVDEGGKSLHRKRGRDNGQAQHGDNDGARAGRGSGDGIRGDTAAAVENGTAPAVTTGGGRSSAARPRSSGSQERGKKRLLEAELEAAAAEMPEDVLGSGGGGGGEVGRARGKYPRGRNDAAAARAVSPVVSAVAAVAVEGGSSSRRTRGRSLA